MDTVNRLFGCAAGSLLAGVQGWPRQSVHSEGGASSPSHQTVWSGFKATLVKMASFCSMASALGFDLALVPGATPKNPASGLIAQRRPSSPGLSHAMSSPTVNTRHPLNRSGGTSMARLVLPQALGNAPAT